MAIYLGETGEKLPKADRSAILAKRYSGTGGETNLGGSWIQWCDQRQCDLVRHVYPT